ncbi:hypothetical protein SMITH_381 [Smithella sp. ME-1]|nr:hypothetical protein SMITH_381 [Smithella sp. ME-1]
MGAVTFHEHGTPGGKLQNSPLFRYGTDVIKAHIHPGKLLFKKFAGAGSAFISRETLYYLIVFIDGINHEIFAA